MLVAIAYACAIFAGLITETIPPVAAGLAILFFPALGHVAGLIYVMNRGKTEAAVIIFTFGGFWLTLGTTLICKIDTHSLLKVLEPAIFLVIILFQWFYRTTKHLQHILWGLATTVAWLWLGKFFAPMSGISWLIVSTLGLWALLLAFWRVKNLPGEATAKT
ncbi:MAG: hypothetical protein NTV81_04105 [Candidatus Komeilibacteria bacterium]|nr:hypothetical protein [Candidatus Komeilibacteria bacterium]